MRGEITRLLDRITEGDKAAFDDLFPLVYDEIHAIAARHMKRDGPNTTLQTTVLVNEACARLLGQKEQNWETRAHFLHAAAQAMRRVLVDYARKRVRKKRGGGKSHRSTQLVDSIAAPNGMPAEDLLGLDEALGKLKDYDGRKARMVELRYFGGLSCEETCRVLGVSKRTVERDISFSLAWLQRAMEAS